jgi:hypothetical protein
MNLLQTSYELITNFLQASYEAYQTSNELLRNYIKTSYNFLKNFQASLSHCLLTSNKCLMNFKHNSALLMNFLQHSYCLPQTYRLITLFGYGPLSQKRWNLLKLFFVATGMENTVKLSLVDL